MLHTENSASFFSETFVNIDKVQNQRSLQMPDICQGTTGGACGEKCGEISSHDKWGLTEAMKEKMSTIYLANFYFVCELLDLLTNL